MFAPTLREQLVNRAAGRDRLKNFLELPLGVDLQRLFFEPFEVGAHELENEASHRLQVTIEIDRTEERFESVAQSGIALPAAARLFSAPHEQMPAEIDLSGMDFERFARDETGAPGREATFARFVETGEKMFRDDELQNRVAEEFEALIVEVFSLFFVGHARVGEGLGEKVRIAKPILNLFFERMHGRSR